MSKKGDQTKAILSGLSDVLERLQTLEEGVEKRFKKQEERIGAIYDKVITNSNDTETSTTTKKTRKKKDRDPNEPKKPPSAYIIWQNEYRPKLVKKYEKVDDADEKKEKIAADLKEAWADEDTKAKYTKIYEKKKAEHVKALAAYRASKAANSDDGGEDDGDETEEEVVAPVKKTKANKKKSSPPKAESSKRTTTKKKKAAVVEPSDEDDDEDGSSSEDEVVQKLRGRGGKKPASSAPTDKELSDLLNDSD